MSYDKSHKESECDRCLKDVGIDNLYPIPFLYLDRNDKVHDDLGERRGKTYKHYRQYYVCKKCLTIEETILKQAEQWKKC